MTEKDFHDTLLAYVKTTSMPSLTEYNEQRLKQIAEVERTAHLAGVLCPDCLKQDKEIELHQETDWVCLSIPPKVTVWCPECKFRGHKIA